MKMVNGLAQVTESSTYTTLKMAFNGVILSLLLQHSILTSPFAVSGYHYNGHLHHSLATDKAALLAFKKAVISDPDSVLENWSEDVHVCNFTGIQCGKHNHRVKELSLSNCELSGPLSPILSNLTGLRSLKLMYNHFFGIIPPELSYIRHLRFLDLDFNNLQGSIPESFALLTNLKVVTMAFNKLTGTLPPSFFSNCTSIRVVDLSNNFFTGEIPQEVGNCPLWSLSMYSNGFTGQLPISLANHSIYYIDVEDNYLSGELPGMIVAGMTDLGMLHLSHNIMISHDKNTNLETFFTALGNCTSLKELELAGMGLGGRFPNSIGRLSTTLTSMLLDGNQIFGSIPPGIANLYNLTVLNLTFNSLNGTISPKISQLSNLEQLFLSHNKFTGEIPAALGHLPHLGLLDLSYNQFSGEIPESLGNLVRVNSLFLNNNQLSGNIPSTLGGCTDLYRLDLSYNRLTGSIPPEISRLREIRIFLNLSHNFLSGQLPIVLSKLENVQDIDVSSNNFNGSIFPLISNCIALRMLNLSRNFLQGHIPESLGDLRNLETLDVSANKLSGEIPQSLNRIRALTFIDLSFNDFEGPIPSGGIFDSIKNASLTGNPHLCVAVSGKLTCFQKKHWFNSKFLIMFVLGIVVSLCLSTVCCVIAIRRMKMVSSGNTMEMETARKSSAAPELIHNFPRITYRELSEATGGFDAQRLIGTGSYGRVYKGSLSDGTLIAVKVLHLQTGNSTKSFNRECQVLKRIRHRNLIRIITACSLPDFKALVLPYMANGSLDSRLYPHSGKDNLGSGSSDLTLTQRVNICSDIAEGMAYLHHHSPVKVIHCDLKPSNVLLNDDMTALVSDFGIAKLVMTVGGGTGGAAENMGNSTANLLRGSIGYIAPEYGLGSTTSTKGDVYSFGILVLEMVTRKRPTDDMFIGGLNLHKWVKNHYHGRVERVIDSSLVRASRNEPPEVKKMWEVAVSELIELGIFCTQVSPSIRPTMLDVADDLNRLKKYLNGDATATFASSLGISSSNMEDD